MTKTFPILADRLEEQARKERKVLKMADRILVAEAIRAGGTLGTIADRFDVSVPTVRKIKKEMMAVPKLIVSEAQPKSITDCIAEVYSAIGSLPDEDKLKVLLTAGFLYGLTPGLG